MLHEELGGLRGVDALRRFAIDPLHHGVRELLAERAPGWDGSELRLIRTKYKPAHKLSAYYVLPDGRHVAVAWTNESIQVLVSPDDPVMPELAALHDPAHLSDLLGFAGRVDTIRYRPGQRHVLRVTGPDHAVFVKVDRDDSGARAVPVAQALGGRLADQAPGARLAEPIGYSAADRAALWRSSPGEPLWQRFDSESATGLVHLVGRALRALHDMPLADLPLAGDRPRDVEAEIGATVRAGEHIATLLPDVGAEYLSIVQAVADDLAQIPAEAPTFAHGDLKSDNVLASGEQVRLLDLDRCGPADPALDLGKFVADLHWWCGSDGERAAALGEAFREGYGEGASARWDRATHLVRLFRLKLAARRCAVHDPAWEADVRARISTAAPVLAGGA